MAYYILKMISMAACLMPRCLCEHLGQTLGYIGWLAVPEKRKRMAREPVRYALVPCCWKSCAFP